MTETGVRWGMRSINRQAEVRQGVGHEQDRAEAIKRRDEKRLNGEGD